jgi:hypothetical protein
MQPETRYARSKDGHVAYQVIGQGPRDLVFIPSWANNIEVIWEEPSLARFLHRLAAGTDERHMRALAGRLTRATGPAWPTSIRDSRSAVAGRETGDPP